MKAKFLAVAAAVAATFVAVPASALELINNDNPTGVTFTGFDWAQGGTAYTTGFQPVTGDTFTLTYFAWATAVVNGKNPIPLANQLNLDFVADGTKATPTGYEYTVVATVNEVVDSCTGLGATGSCTFSITGGNFNIYYDTAANANADTGTGFTDGTSIVSGNLFGPDTTFTTSAGALTGQPSGQAIATLFGTNLITDTNFIKPAVGSATSSTTLQLGDNQTNTYSPPSQFNGTSLPPPSPDVVFQADGNSSFTPASVPEPGSLLLLSLGLGVMGWRLRKRS
jgi:hypothetical protein